MPHVVYFGLVLVLGDSFKQTCFLQYKVGLGLTGYSGTERGTGDISSYLLAASLSKTFVTFFFVSIR